MKGLAKVLTVKLLASIYTDRRGGVPAKAAILSANSLRTHDARPRVHNRLRRHNFTPSSKQVALGTPQGAVRREFPRGRSPRTEPPTYSSQARRTRCLTVMRLPSFSLAPTCPSQHAALLATLDSLNER